MGWLVANTKTKRGKTPKTTKGTKNVKNEHFEKRKKKLFSHSHKELIFKKNRLLGRKL